MAKQQGAAINEKSLLTRGLRVIDAVSRSSGGLRFGQIAALLDNPSPATVNKILKELLAENVLQRAGDGAYVLAAKVRAWSASAAASVDEAALVHAELERLHRSLRVTTKAFVRVGEQLYCTDGFVDEASPALMAAGNHAAINVGVLGAVFFLSESELLSHRQRAKETSMIHADVGIGVIHRILDAAIRNGFEDDRGLYYPGSRRLAAPVRVGGAVRYTLGIGAMPVRFQDKSFLTNCRAELLDSCQRLQKALVAC